MPRRHSTYSRTETKNVAKLLNAFVEIRSLCKGQTLLLLKLKLRVARGTNRLYAELTLAMPTEPDKPGPAGTVKIVHFDWAMKALLRDKANFAILEGFLHSLLDEPVTIEQILESESNAESENARFNRGRSIWSKIPKGGTSSSKCRMNVSPTILNACCLAPRNWWSTQSVEASPTVTSRKSFRFTFSTSILVRALTTSTAARPSCAVSIPTNRCWFPSDLSTTRGAARYRRRDVFPEYHVINVDRFNKIDEEDLEMLDQWIYLFKQSEVRGDFDAPGMETARERLAYLKMDQDQRKAYDRHMDNFVRELDIMGDGS